MKKILIFNRFRWKLLPTSGLSMMLLSMSHAAPPTLDGLLPAEGSTHIVVEVQGERLQDAVTIWDVGLPTQTMLPGTIAGAVMFSVPDGAAKGVHPVAVENAGGRSNTVDFQVTSPGRGLSPRIDDIMVLRVEFDDHQIEEISLYIQGANLDVGSTVLVDGREINSRTHRVMVNDLLGSDQSALGYPVFHYLSRVLTLRSVRAGQQLRFQVRNEGGAESNRVTWQLPDSLASLDSDGDSLLDVWETDGYDADGDGVVDIPLPALGADPHRKNIFLELDVMEGLTYPPSPQVIENARRMFDDAPILNPVGPDGIGFFVDASGSVPAWSIVRFSKPHDPRLGIANFATLKKGNFDSAIRQGVFHYAIWARAHENGWSGESDIDIGGSDVGDDFLVSFDSFGPRYNTRKSQAATLVHELGHNLGQFHGGNNHSRYKPNYFSSMAYTWQLRTGHDDNFRLKRPTCTPFYYGAAGAVEFNGRPPSSFSNMVYYSEGMGPTLKDNNGSLDETIGVCGHPIDWNGDGDTDDTGVSVDIDPDSINQPVTDFANWPNLKYHGISDGGTSRP